MVARMFSTSTLVRGLRLQGLYRSRGTAWSSLGHGIV